MSVRKPSFFVMLATVVAFAVVERPNVQNQGFGAPAPSPFPLLPVQSRNTKDLAAGKLLVASRNLGDPNFIQTVVLLVHYDAQGAVGLVVNRRSHVPLSHVLEGLEAARDRSDPVYLGGPVETPAVFALLQSPSKLEGAERVFGGVYMISNKTLFEKTISARPGPGTFHVYLGYAGWTNEQLRMEVEQGAWFIFPADAKAVFDSDPDSLWSKMIQKTELKLAGSEPADAAKGGKRGCPRQAALVGGTHMREDCLGHPTQDIAVITCATRPVRPERGTSIAVNRHGS